MALRGQSLKQAVRVRDKIMGDFFKPWRRKIGAVTLVMSCIFMAAWITTAGTIILIRSMDSRVVIEMWPKDGHDPWEIEFFNSQRPINVTSLFLGEMLFFWEWRGFASGEWSATFVRLWTVPYWSIVMPLTLLSAYLLLSKTRVAKPKTIVENGSSE